MSGSAGCPVWGRMGPSGQVVGPKSLLSNDQQTEQTYNLLEDIYGCGESSLTGPFGFELCDSAFSHAEVTCSGAGADGKALIDLEMIIEGLDMSMEQDFSLTPVLSAPEMNFTGYCGQVSDYVSFKVPFDLDGMGKMGGEGYMASKSDMDDVLESCLWDGSLCEPFDSGFTTSVPSVTPSLEEDAFFLASLEKLRQMLESTVPTSAPTSEAYSHSLDTMTVGHYRATSVDSFDDSPFFSLSPSPAPTNFPTCPATSAVESPVPTPPPPRKSNRQRKASTKGRISKSPSTSSFDSTASQRTGKKVTPKKRGQNVKAARNYRQKKKDQEQDKMKDHQLVMAERDCLLQLHNSLQQELRFALKMAQARLDRLS